MPNKPIRSRRPVLNRSSPLRTGSVTAVVIMFISLYLLSRELFPTPRFHTTVDIDALVPSSVPAIDLEMLAAAHPHNASLQAAVRVTRMAAFHKWLGVNEGVRLSASSVDHKGIYSRRRLQSGHVIARVPVTHILTLRNVRESVVGQRLSNIVGPSLSLHAEFGTFLALERKNVSSFWAPYLRVLPQSFDFMPVLADEAALVALNGTSARQLVAQRRSEIDGEFSRIRLVFPGLAAEEFHWGVLCSMTRAAGIRIDDGTTTSGFVPLLNEFRNGAGRQSNVKSRFRDGFYVISTTTTVSAGDELTRYYGERPAQIFYSDYGDVPAVITSSDTFRLDFPLFNYSVPAISDAVGSWLRTFLLGSDVNSRSVRDCISFLRVRHASPEEWRDLISTQTDLLHAQFISSANEARAWNAFKLALQEKIENLRCDAGNQTETPENRGFFVAQRQAQLMCGVEKRIARSLLSAINEGPLPGSEKSDITVEVIPDTGDAFVDARKWLIQSGAELDAVDIVQYDGEHGSFRGMEARRSIKKDSPLITVPLADSVTSLLAARESLAGKEAASNNITLQAHTLMATFLIVESNNPSSKFRYFQNMFPATFDSLPMYYPDEDIGLLNGTRALTILRTNKAELRTDYELVCKAAPETVASYNITFDKYRRARHSVDSRNFLFNPRGQARQHIMVPYADMMNHGLEANTIWKFATDSCTFIVAASRDIAVGETIITSYGDKSNSDLFIGYGFTLPENPHEMATLRLNKHVMCTVHKIFGSSFTSACFTKFRKHFVDEVAVLRAIIAGAKEGLSRFAQTIEEDEKLLATMGPADERRRNCIVVRLGEKRVLRFWQEAAEILLQVQLGGMNRAQIPAEFDTYFWDLESSVDGRYATSAT